MKIHTTAEAFVSALKSSLKPGKKSSIPVLQFVKLYGNQIHATDLDLSTIVDFEAVSENTTRAVTVGQNRKARIADLLEGTRFEPW